MRSAANAASRGTRAKVRVVGDIVVSPSCSAFISPRPLKRCSLMPLWATDSTASRSASNDGACSPASPRRTSNGGVPASSSSCACTRASWRYSCESKSVRLMRCVRAKPVFASTALTRISSGSSSTSSARCVSPSTVARASSSIAASALIACSSSIEDSSRNWTISWPCAARSDDAQPSYCFSNREKRCQRVSVSLNWVPWGSELPHVWEQDLLEFGVLLDVALARALLELVEGRLGDVHVARLDQLLHLAEQQG